MMDHRKIVKRKPEKPAKEPTNISTLELSIPSPNDSNKSLLIHDEECDIFSEPSNNDQDIQDADFHLDKMSILNNPNYFKQLSLSFYGTSRPSQKPKNSQPDNHFVLKTEGSQPETSNSPRANREYYVGLKRPSFYKKIDRESFQLNTSSFSKGIHKPQLTLSGSRVGLQYTKGRVIERNDSREYINSSKIEIKPYRITNKGNTPLTKGTLARMYPQLAHGIANSSNVQSSITPRKSSFFGYDTSATAKQARKPSIKTSVSTKPKVSAQEYLLTEPNALTLKTSKSSTNTVIPKKLKMYAIDNLGMFNFRNSVEGKLSTNRSSSREKFPIRPQVPKGVQEMAPKRSVVTFKSPTLKRNAYYD